MYTYLVCKEKVISELTYSFKPKTAFSKMRLRVVVQSSDRSVTRYTSCTENLFLNWAASDDGRLLTSTNHFIAEFCCNRIFITFLVSMSFKQKVRNQHLNLIGNSHIDQNWCFNLYCIKLKWQPMFSSQNINEILLSLFLFAKMSCRISEWCQLLNVYP